MGQNNEDLAEVLGLHKKRPKKRRKNKQEEKKVAYEVAEHLNLKHPDVVFRFDAGADLKLTIGQAMTLKEKLRHDRGFHDVTLFEARGGYFGLCLELKKNKSEVYKKDGKTLRRKWDKHTESCHVQEQHAHILNMQAKGYYSVYGFGTEHSIKLIDDYMAQPLTSTLL